MVLRALDGNCGKAALASWFMFIWRRSIAGYADAFFVEMFFQFVEDRANLVERRRAGSGFFQLKHKRQRFGSGDNAASAASQSIVPS